LDQGSKEKQVGLREAIQLRTKLLSAKEIMQKTLIPFIRISLTTGVLKHRFFIALKENKICAWYIKEK